MSSIDYLIKEFSAILGPIKTEPMRDLLLVDAIVKAKEMHKQEIKAAYVKGCDDTYGCDEGYDDDREAEGYYQETFKN